MCQVEPGVQLLPFPAAPILRSLSFSGREELVAKVARKVEQIGGDRRRDSTRTRCRGDEGIHRRQPHD